MHRLSSRVPRDWWDVLLAMEPPEMAAMLKPEMPQTRYPVLYKYLMSYCNYITSGLIKIV